MENVFTVFGAVIALLLLVVIAEPYRFFPEFQEKKKKVGASYWGFYPGTDSDDPEALQTVELKNLARKGQYCVGSATYSKGRGVKMSGRG